VSVELVVVVVEEVVELVMGGSEGIPQERRLNGKQMDGNISGNGRATKRLLLLL
jgi:hypothetical protein